MKSPDRRILTINGGSSSIKFALFAGDDPPKAVLQGGIERIGQPGATLRLKGLNPIDNVSRPVAASDHTAAANALMDIIEEYSPNHDLAAIGHRVVHGGPNYSNPRIIGSGLIQELRRLSPFDPEHLPDEILLIEAFQRRFPHLPQVACFDTAFHHTLPLVESSFALPRALTADGLRRYGFHGLSYEYIAGALPALTGAAIAAGRVVVAHLGAGASMCAMVDGRSVATTMSLTPLDGLPMGSRCGSLDPGALLYLLKEKAMPVDAVTDLLYHHSGLLGVSGLSADMQTLLDSDAPEAAEAVDLFVYRISRELGSLAAALGGLDALVFTAGIGEHGADIRHRVCKKAAWLGIDLDPAANDAGGPRLTRAGSAVSAWVLATDEDAMIMEHSRRLLGLR